MREEDGTAFINAEALPIPKTDLLKSWRQNFSETKNSENDKQNLCWRGVDRIDFYSAENIPMGTLEMQWLI